jgi:hypothetical protein
MLDLVGILLFTLGSFSSVYNCTHSVALNDGLVSKEMERMWKEVVMAKLEILSWNFPGGTEENHRKPYSL